MHGLWRLCNGREDACNMSTLAEVSTRRQGVSAESVQVTSSYAEVARDLLATFLAWSPHHLQVACLLV